jgi:hypothetical protein
LTASRAINFAVTLPAAPGVTAGGVGPTSPPAQQPTLTLTLNSAFPVAIAGVATLTFQSAVGGTDDTVQFLTGGRTVNFTVNAGSTQAAFGNAANVGIQTGTVAGTITIAVTLSAGGVSLTPSPVVVRTVTIDQGPPVITRVNLVRDAANSQVIAEITGFTTTRSLTNASLHFNAAGGATLQGADITVPLDQPAAAFFAGAASNATGGQFTVSIPVRVSGSLNTIANVSGTVSNARGASNSITSQ